MEAKLGPTWCQRRPQNRTFWHHVRKKGGKIPSKNGTKKTTKSWSKNDPKMGGSGMQNRASRSILVSKYTFSGCRDFYSKNDQKRVPKMILKSTLGRSGIPFLRFLDAFWYLRFSMDFRPAKSQPKNGKKATVGWQKHGSGSPLLRAVPLRCAQEHLQFNKIPTEGTYIINIININTKRREPAFWG